MPSCSVFSCKKRSQTSNFQKDNVTFHLFPKDEMLRDVWIRACANHVSWKPKRTSTICSQHFETSCFKMQSKNKRKLNEGAIPTLKLPKVCLCQETQPGTPLSEITKTDALRDPLKIETEPTENGAHVSQDSQAENICQLPPRRPLIDDTPRIKFLKKIIAKKNAQIKRLHSQIRYLKTKTDEQQEILNELKEKSLIDK